MTVSTKEGKMQMKYEGDEAMWKVLKNQGYQQKRLQQTVQTVRTQRYAEPAMN